MFSLIQPRRPSMFLSVDYFSILFSVCYYDEYVCTGEGQFCDYTGQCACEDGYIQEAGTKKCILGNITFTHIKIHCFMGHRQTVQTKIIHSKIRCLIRVTIVCM